MEANFSTDGMGDGSGGNASDGEQWRAADEALLTHPPLTSYCAAQFLTRRRPVQVHSLGAGDHWFILCTLVKDQWNV